MVEEANVECRMAELEWDRSHDRFTAIVRAATDHGVVVSELSDLSPLEGLRWIRRDDIVSLEDVTADAPERLLAELRGDLRWTVDPTLTALDSLLAHLQERDESIAVYTDRTGSAELLVGRRPVVEERRLALVEVDPDGNLSGDQLEYDLKSIVALDWGTTYLRGPRRAAPAAIPHPLTSGIDSSGAVAPPRPPNSDSESMRWG